MLHILILILCISEPMILFGTTVLSNTILKPSGNTAKENRIQGHPPHITDYKSET
jgi:hypothetical protein